MSHHAIDPSGGYDRLATAYARLEALAFGRALMRTRLAHLEQLAAAKQVLVVGEGDGRFLASLCRRNPRCRVVCLERSGTMIAHARRRLGPAAARVRFVAEDVRSAAIDVAGFDLIVTQFVLDIFDDGELARLVPRLASGLKPGGHWLLADFTLPQRPPARWRAQLWLALLLAFFRWQTDLQIARLHDPTPHLAAAGLVGVDQQRFQAGLLTSRLFRKE